MYSNMAFASSTLVDHRRRSSSSICIEDQNDSIIALSSEAVNNLYKTELIRQQGPWRTVEQVELATLKYVWWWNHERLHGELDMRTPAEVEQAYYAETETLLSPTG